MRLLVPDRSASSSAPTSPVSRGVNQSTPYLASKCNQTSRWRGFLTTRLASGLIGRIQLPRLKLVVDEEVDENLLSSNLPLRIQVLLKCQRGGRVTYRASKV